MQRVTEIIRGITEAPFGFCDFSSIKDRLLPCRAAARLPENAKTVIVFAFPYKVKEAPPQNISRYAAVPDYHGVCGKLLETLAAALGNAYTDYCFSPFIDNSPIPEVEAAVRAGLGVRGKNGLLLTEEYGSFVFIGDIVTNMPLPTDDRFAECINCGACMRACPVGLRKDSCLSAVSQQKRELSAEQAKMLKDSGCIWGCDICQNVCPQNKNTKITDIAEFACDYRDRYTAGEDISGRAFEWRGEKVILRNSLL